ncbi:MAG: hypothetical protein ACQER7_11215 [Bacteroidota bacterium]
MGKQPDIKAFIIRRDTHCGVCGEEIGKGSMITFDREKTIAEHACRKYS